jgi:hypothetical protein
MRDGVRVSHRDVLGFLQLRGSRDLSPLEG